MVHTGQHYDEQMSAVFFDELGIPAPKHHLEVGSASHGVQTGRMLERLEPVVVAEGPDIVLVYGDTNSTLAGALVASKLHIPVAHVEAGLRSFNRFMPEEQNRVVADHLSDILFAPTEVAVQNLLREGIDRNAIGQTGDVMYDVALLFAERATQRTIIADLSLTKGGYCLATIHRAENTDDDVRLQAILDGFCAVAKELPVVLPLHPRTRNRLGQEACRHLAESGLRIIAPVGYLDMVALERQAAIIATDSGGVQKEAFFYEVPCVTLRDETEWVELVELGWNRVVPPRSAQAVADALLAARGVRGRAGEPYGEGNAAALIAARLAGVAKR
jgi:UDP-GlcNAc3NAcA epimerase